MANQKLLLRLDSYYKELDKTLICKANIKKDFMADLKHRIDEFAEENQVTSVDEIIAHFGRPEEIAQTFLETYQTNKIKNAMNWKKIVIIGVLTALLLLIIYLVASFIDGHKEANGYGIMGEAIEEPFETSEG